MEFLDTVNWDIVAKVVPAVATIVAALLGAIRGGKSLRSDILQDVEILEKLPEGSGPRNLMLEHLTTQITRLNSEHMIRREFPMLVFAFISGSLLGWATIALWQMNQWWAYPLAVGTGTLTLIFVYGVFDSAQLKYRPPTKSSAQKKAEKEARGK
ncbi:hypothetical protein HWD94_03895 [Pseudarthrobacter equi]|uniref:hypothetical protein n=1 Tax=Pseudarthrobacter equi TaxID=728066 RepID=UPI0021C161BE|nr:hypothetical protein [Pseudarthrobacter equi]MCT9624266.1 hypothetical protein [Pseudarthrobacter equi]